MRRELDEEVIVETPYTARCVGLINDDQTDVGRVHLGVVHIFDVDAAGRPPARGRDHRVRLPTRRRDPRRHGRLRDLVADLHGGVVWDGVIPNAAFGRDQTAGKPAG